MRRFLTAVLAAITVLTLVGCAGTPSQPESTNGSAPVAALAAMGADQKRAELGANFPIEVPVVAGRVVRGEEQGPDAWAYEVIAEAPVSTVAEWYRQAYEGREWTVTGQTALEGGGSELSMQKGTAQSRVTVSPEGTGSRVLVILGVGAPVLETQ
jgi:hypothetical protein